VGILSAPPKPLHNRNGVRDCSRQIRALGFALPRDAGDSLR
jgi:hypothetical protein